MYVGDKHEVRDEVEVFGRRCSRHASPTSPGARPRALDRQVTSWEHGVPRSGCGWSGIGVDEGERQRDGERTVEGRGMPRPLRDMPRPT